MRTRQMVSVARRRGCGHRGRGDKEIVQNIPTPPSACRTGNTSRRRYAPRELDSRHICASGQKVPHCQEDDTVPGAEPLERDQRVHTNRRLERQGQVAYESSVRQATPRRARTHRPSRNDALRTADAATGRVHSTPLAPPRTAYMELPAPWTPSG